MEQTTSQHCGYIVFFGRPNMGKSTLLNACVGQKIAGISKKPQMTRNRILGIDCIDNTQLIFLDTPGVQKRGKLALNRAMNQVAWSTAAEGDLICYLVAIDSPWTDYDTIFLQQLLMQTETRILVLATKTDRYKKDVVKESLAKLKNQLHAALESLTANLPEGAAWQDRFVGLKPYPISAKRKDEVLAFKRKLARLMPEGAFLFADDDITDRSQKFVVSEMIRESVFRNLGQEIPYGTSVLVEDIQEREQIVDVHGTLIVSQDSHKGIVIGRGGNRLRLIGEKARLTLERHFANKVNLQLQVQVHKGWADNMDWVQQYQNMIEN